MIEIEKVSKSYGNLTVYDNFSLSLNEGEITCVLGESGSGKTTLLNMIARLTDFTGKIPQLKVSYVFQTPCLVNNLTVAGNLKLVCKEENKVFDILKRVRLYDKANTYPLKLSGGQAQRVSLCRAFLHNGDIILLDEPFSSLDVKLKKEVRTCFLDLQKEYARTAVFVTHDILEATEIADRIIVIKGGKITLDLKVDKPKDNSEVNFILKEELNK